MTQATATFLCNRTTRQSAPAFDGVRFTSRHGDDFGLWAVFERPRDIPASHLITPLTPITCTPVTADSREVEAVFTLLNLTWPTA